MFYKLLFFWRKENIELSNIHFDVKHKHHIPIRSGAKLCRKFVNGPQIPPHKNIRTLIIIVVTCWCVIYIIIVNRCYRVTRNWSRILYMDKRIRNKYEIIFNFYDRGIRFNRYRMSADEKTGHFRFGPENRCFFCTIRRRLISHSFSWYFPLLQNNVTFVLPVFFYCEGSVNNRF